MTTGGVALPSTLLPSLRDGSFPASEDLLTSDIPASAVPPILDAVSEAKKELGDEIRVICREQGKDVDEWIAQAKKVQEDIARCKVVAREIVGEHKRVKGLEAAVQDARNKVDLLHGELRFSSTVQKEMESARSATRSLNGVQTSLMNGAWAKAAAELQLLKTSISERRVSRTKTLLEERRAQLVHDTHAKLETALDSHIKFGNDKTCSWMEVAPETVTQGLHTDAILQAFQRVGTLHMITTKLTNKVQDFLVQPLVAIPSQNVASSAHIDQGRLSLGLSSNNLDPEIVLQNTEETIKFLHAHLPEQIRVPVAAQILPGLISTVITDWLTPAIPYDLELIPKLKRIEQMTRQLAETLNTFEWPGQQDLLEWIENIPGIWLNRRKMASLDSVRKALSSPRGPVRQAERIESHVISKEDLDSNEKDEKGEKRAENEEVSGWDFDDDDDESESKEKNHHPTTEVDEANDAWGWEDEDLTEAPSSHQSKPNNSNAKVAINGVHDSDTVQREITMVESYTITDIPDYLLEIIGRDILDAQAVKELDYAAIQSVSPSAGLLALPNFSLAMFRAIAPTYYSTSLNSGNMHLYNDAMYVAQKLRGAHQSPEISDSCQAMDKFARSAYAREMEVQRTILGDILDGAQGFVKCTQSPYLAECETAVTSTVDRIRAIHTEWSSVLSHSALLQSTGSLIRTVLDKIIVDIEDMDDISEPQSRQLAAFCTQVSALEDLFLTPDSHSPALATEHEVSSPVIYVPNWLRFQYLANILEASLVDIRYLWTEGELALEFEPDEVIDLIKALFADTTHRRSAIAAIRA